MGGIIADLKLSFSEFVMSYVQVCPTNCNRVADVLAAFGCNNPSDEHITWQGVPYFVEDLVASESAASVE